MSLFFTHPSKRFAYKFSFPDALPSGRRPSVCGCMAFKMFENCLLVGRHNFSPAVCVFFAFLFRVLAFLLAQKACRPWREARAAPLAVTEQVARAHALNSTACLAGEKRPHW